MNKISNRIFQNNFIIVDAGKEGCPVIKRFDYEKEAEEFIENHERPNDLLCEFKKKV